MADVFGVMAIFKDLLKAMHPFSRNILIHSQLRKFTDFQKPSSELQSKKSCLIDRYDRNWLSGGERVLAQERVGNQQRLQDCWKPRVLTRQGFVSVGLQVHSMLLIHKGKVSNMGQDISMLTCILNLLAMLIMALAFR